MRIEYIKIYNYRQYENLELRFDKTNKNDLHIILAENGIGKTTLLNSINWCLYGDEPHITLENKALPRINLSQFNEIPIDSTINLEVEISIKINETQLIFQRSETFKKVDENKPFCIDNTFKVIETSYGNETNIYENEEASKHINRYIPKRIRQFFFFDGEQLDTYFTKETGVNVEQAIFEISQIDILKGIETNLETLSDETRREISRNQPNLRIANEEFENARNSLREQKNILIEINKQKEKCKSELSIINNRLGSEPDIEELEMERENLVNEIEKISEDILEVQNERREFIIRYTILLNSLEDLYDLQKLIIQKDKDNQLPPKIDRDELMNILNTNTCSICDRELSDGAKIHVEMLIKKYELSNDLAILLKNLSGKIDLLLNEAKEYQQKKNKILTRMNHLEEIKEEYSIRYNKINSEISRYSDKDEISRLQKNRLILEDELEKLILNEGSTLHHIETLKKEYENKKSTLNKEQEKSDKHDKKFKKYELIKDAKNITSKIIEDIKQDVKSKIEYEINHNFFEFIWKKDTFREIILSEKYQLSLFHVDGYESLGSCSAAERALLALSFTLALHKESGYAGPLVIDTPISRISGVLRERFAEVLREVSLNKQIILFLTEDEYSKNVKKVFDGHTSMKYKLTLENERYVRKEVF